MCCQTRELKKLGVSMRAVVVNLFRDYKES